MKATRDSGSDKTMEKLERLARMAFHHSSNENESIVSFQKLKTLLIKEQIDIADLLDESSLTAKLRKYFTEIANLRGQISKLETHIRTLNERINTLDSHNKEMFGQCEHQRKLWENAKKMFIDKDEQVRQLEILLAETRRAAEESRLKAAKPLLEDWWRSLDLSSPTLTRRQIRGWISTTDLYEHLYLPWARSKGAEEAALESFGMLLKADATTHAGCPFKHRRKSRANGFMIISPPKTPQ